MWGLLPLYSRGLSERTIEAKHTERVTVKYWYHNLNMRPGYQYFFPLHSCCCLQWFEPIFQITLSSSLAPAILSLALPLIATLMSQSNVTLIQEAFSNHPTTRPALTFFREFITRKICI